MLITKSKVHISCSIASFVLRASSLGRRWAMTGVLDATTGLGGILIERVYLFVGEIDFSEWNGLARSPFETRKGGPMSLVTV